MSAGRDQRLAPATLAWGRREATTAGAGVPEPGTAGPRSFTTHLPFKRSPQMRGCGLYCLHKLLCFRALQFPSKGPSEIPQGPLGCRDCHSAQFQTASDTRVGVQGSPPDPVGSCASAPRRWLRPDRPLEPPARPNSRPCLPAAPRANNRHTRGRGRARPRAPPTTPTARPGNREPGTPAPPRWCPPSARGCQRAPALRPRARRARPARALTFSVSLSFTVGSGVLVDILLHFTSAQCEGETKQHGLGGAATASSSALRFRSGGCPQR